MISIKKYQCGGLVHSVTKKKWSVAEGRYDSGSYRLTKQECAGRFLGSIRMRKIFQFEVWNSSNFVIIFSFIEKSIKKIEINTIDWCYVRNICIFFQDFSSTSCSRNEVLSRKNMIRTLKNVIKYTIWRLALDETRRKVTQWLGTTQENTWNFVQNAIKEVLLNGIQRKLTR